MATKQRRTTDREVTSVNLPGVTAEIHQPEHYIPTRDDLAGVVNTVRAVSPWRSMIEAGRVSWCRRAAPEQVDDVCRRLAALPDPDTARPDPRYRLIALKG